MLLQAKYRGFSTLSGAEWAAAKSAAFFGRNNKWGHTRCGIHRPPKKYFKTHEHFCHPPGLDQ